MERVLKSAIYRARVSGILNCLKGHRTRKDFGFQIDLMNITMVTLDSAENSEHNPLEAILSVYDRDGISRVWSLTIITCHTFTTSECSSPNMIQICQSKMYLWINDQYHRAMIYKIVHVGIILIM